jgi:hypothetical protein
MSHLNDDQLLLLSYSELADHEARDAETHLAACTECRARFERLERARVAVEWTGPRARVSRSRWIAAGLAAAAVLAAVFLMRAGNPPTANPNPDGPLTTVWSTTAGYIAGGSEVVQIDAQLTRLEQERYDAFPD